MLQRLKNLDYLKLTLWVIRIAIIVVAIWGTAVSLMDEETPFTAHELAKYLVIGVTQGSLYALIALGYTLVYGVLLMINFAHGEFFMSGITAATMLVAIPMGASGFLDRQPVIGLLVVMVLAMVVSVAVALLTERVAYRPLRKAPRLIPLITAIGASFFWQYFFRGLFGSNVIAFPEIQALKGSIPFLGTELLKTHLVVIVATIVILIGLNFFIMRTKTGKAIRAVSEDKDAAALMGIDIDRTISITFATGAAMAGVAGVLFAIVFRQVHFFMGFVPGI